MSRAAIKRARWAILLGIPVGVAGCASTPVVSTADPSDPSGVVGMRPFEPGATPEVGRLALASHESFLMPVGDLANRPPVYPESRLPGRWPPQVVCLRLAVGTDGRVHDVADVTGRPGCEIDSPSHPDFASAAMHAVQGWRFEPAVRCVFASAADRQAASNTGCANAEEIPEAVSLHYRFVFEQVDGRGAVRLVP